MAIHKHESVYLYPITPFTYKKGSNDYIVKKKIALENNFKVINSSTKLGLLDVLLKLPKTDIVYFNWIEDLPSKRFGRFQIPLLLFILILSKISNKKIVWFVHNNISHSKNRWSAKRRIQKLMTRFADKILSHSEEVDLNTNRAIDTFPHPVDNTEFVINEKPRYDVLLWGKVSKYKGVEEFIKFNYAEEAMRLYSICVAGKFPRENEGLKINYKKDNLFIEDKILEEDELDYFMAVSRCVLFAYNSESVLSSAALCKTLSKGKIIIGPDKGAFRELAEANLIITYKDYNDIPRMLNNIKKDNLAINQARIRNYIRNHGWDDFANFLFKNLHSSKPGIFPAIPGKSARRNIKQTTF